MELVDHRGRKMPLIGLPGGPLLLGTGSAGGLHLQNRGEELYAFGEKKVILNPHFVFAAPATVELMRTPDGRTCGMCFENDEFGDFLGEAEKESLYADLAGRLATALEGDADLYAYVVRQCADADVQDAEIELGKAARALVRAGRAANEARIRRGDAGLAAPDPGGSRPALFLVTAAPSGWTEGQREAFQALQGGVATACRSLGVAGPTNILVKE